DRYCECCDRNESSTHNPARANTATLARIDKTDSRIIQRNVAKSNRADRSNLSANWLLVIKSENRTAVKNWVNSARFSGVKLGSALTCFNTDSRAWLSKLRSTWRKNPRATIGTRKIKNPGNTYVFAKPILDQPGCLVDMRRSLQDVRQTICLTPGTVG